MASTDKELASRYAKAFLHVLGEMDKQDLEKFEQDLTDLQVLLEGTPGAFFASPLFELEEKQTVLEKVLADSTVQEQTVLFVKALNLASHLYLLGDILDYFGKQRLEFEQQVRVELRTAFELKGEQEQRLQKIFESVFGKKVSIEKTVDSTLIGGISANVGGMVFEASIAGYLNRLEKQFHG